MWNYKAIHLKHIELAKKKEEENVTYELVRICRTNVNTGESTHEIEYGLNPIFRDNLL